MYYKISSQNIAFKPPPTPSSSSHNLRVRTPHDVEVGLAVVADGISRAAILYLILVRPALIERTIGGRAEFAWTRGVLGIDCEAVVAAHDGEIVGGALNAVECTVAELEERLRSPLGCGGLVGRARDAHANALVRGLESAVGACWDVDGLGDGVHGEAGADLVDAEAHVRAAVVVDGDIESIAAGSGAWDWRGSGSAVQMLMAVAGVRNGTRRESQAQEERNALGAHFEGWLRVKNNE